MREETCRRQRVRNWRELVHGLRTGSHTAYLIWYGYTGVGRQESSMKRYFPLLLSFTLGLLMLFPGIYCQFNGQIYRKGEGPYFGWPFVQPGDEFRFLSNAFMLNILSIIAIAAATGFAVNHVICNFKNRARFRLSWMCVCVAILAIVVNMVRLQAVDRVHHWSVDFVGHRTILDPIAVRYPGFVIMPILFGFTCTLYSVALLSTRGVQTMRGKTRR